MLIQLNEIPDHTKTAAGLYIPLQDLAETDGGKVTTRPSKIKHYSVGKILNISPYAKEKLSEFNNTLDVGDTVYIAKHTMSSDAFHFYMDRSKTVQDFKGLICIPHTLIEAKI